MHQHNFRPQTANLQIPTKFDESFAQHRPIINQVDYTNRHTTLHDNLGSKILSENVVEHHVIINSIDRDLNTDSNKLRNINPFSFETTFGNNVRIPNISRHFKNIKYITLNSVLTPRTIEIDTTNAYPNTVVTMPYPANYLHIAPTNSTIVSPTAVASSTPYHDLENQSYLTLKIKELASNQIHNTSNFFGNDTFMLYPDLKLKESILWRPRISSIVYPTSDLANITKFTLKLFDDTNNQMFLYDNTGKNILTNNLGSVVQMNFNDFVISTNNMHITGFNYVDYTNTRMQVIYDFTFGVIENSLNTNVSY